MGTTTAGSGWVPAVAPDNVSRPAGSTITRIRPGIVPTFWNVCELPLGANREQPGQVRDAFDIRSPKIFSIPLVRVSPGLSTKASCITTLLSANADSERRKAQA